MRVFWACVAFFGILLLGCGGGGGAGGGSGNYSLVRVELPGRDPINIVVGQMVNFQLAAYDAITGQRFVIAADTWSVILNPAVGTIDQTGKFTAAAPGTAKIHATWLPGSPPAQDLTIVVRPAGLARVSGSVVNILGGNGIGNVQVILYDTNNVEVGRAITQPNGSFLAQVPTTAQKINLDPATLSGWLNQWQYRNIVYQAGNAIPNCNAIMVLSSPLTSNQTSSLVGSIQLYDTNQPPPFPGGCS